MVNVEDYEEVGIGAFSGAVGSEVIEQKAPETVDIPVIGEMDGPKLINGGVGLASIGLAFLGSRGAGPLKTEGKGFFAGLGASMVGNMVTTSVFETEATEVEVSQASPNMNVQVETPQVQAEAEQPPSQPEETSEIMFEAEETEAATPSGETLGGI